MTKPTLFAGAASLAIALAFAAAPASAQVKVGVAGPITGEYATFGKQLTDGAEQAVADINAKGGVLGQKIELSKSATTPAIRSRRCRSPTSSPATA